MKLCPFRFAILALGLCAWVPYALWGDGQLFLYPFGMVLLYAGAACLVLFAHLVSHSVEGREGSRTSKVQTLSPATWASEKASALLRPLLLVMAWLGVRSYAVYVWHGYFAKPLANRAAMALHWQPAMPGLTGWAYDGLYLLADVAVGAFMFWAVEAPMLRLRARVAPSTPVFAKAA